MLSMIRIDCRLARRSGFWWRWTYNINWRQRIFDHNIEGCSMRCGKMATRAETDAVAKIEEVVWGLESDNAMFTGVRGDKGNHEEEVANSWVEEVTTDATPTGQLGVVQVIEEAAQE